MWPAFLSHFIEEYYALYDCLDPQVSLSPAPHILDPVHAGFVVQSTDSFSMHKRMIC